MESGIEYHVSPAGDLWKVGIPADSQPVSFHQTKNEAIAHAAQLARQHVESRVLVHRADGTVEEEYTHGGVERTG